MSGKAAAAVATCAAVIFPRTWPETCANKAKILGTLTYTTDAGEHKTARVAYCRRHAGEILAGSIASARDRRLEPEFPYLVNGTWAPDPGQEP